MVDATTRFFEDLDRRGYEPLLAKSSGTLRLDLHEGAQTTHWLLRIDRGRLQVSQEDQEADTVVGTSPELFEDIAAGREHGVAALLRGDMTVSGDLRLVRADGAALPRPSGHPWTTSAFQARRRCGDGASNTIRILDGSTFVVSEDTGDIEATPSEPTGFFSLDTRFLSTWVLTVNGDRLNPLSYDDLQYYEARFFLVPGMATHYVDAKLSIIRERAVGGSFREQLTILNHDEKPVDLEIRMDAASDFADLFQVKDEILNKKGEIYTEVESDRLRLGYRRGNFIRGDADLRRPPPRYDSKGFAYSIHLEPNEQWEAEIDVRPRRRPGRPGPADRAAGAARHRAARPPARPGGVDRQGPQGQQSARPGRLDVPAQPDRPGRAALLAALPRRARRCRPPACPGS